jgi:dCTP deaminase
MILGDIDLRHYISSGKLGIKDLTEDSIRENGVDCRIGDTYAIDILRQDVIDTHDKESIEHRFVIHNFKRSIIISPKTNILLATIEEFELPDDLMAFCALRSTVARMGFVSPITIVDAGFKGTLTIEAFYGGNNPIKIYAGDRFLHVVFAKINTFVQRPYNGTYTGQKEVRLPKTMS